MYLYVVAYYNVFVILYIVNIQSKEKRKKTLPFIYTGTLYLYNLVLLKNLTPKEYNMLGQHTHSV